MKSIYIECLVVTPQKAEDKLILPANINKLIIFLLMILVNKITMHPSTPVYTTFQKKFKYFRIKV